MIYTETNLKTYQSVQCKNSLLSHLCAITTHVSSLQRPLLPLRLSSTPKLTTFSVFFLQLLTLTFRACTALWFKNVVTQFFFSFTLPHRSHNFLSWGRLILPFFVYSFGIIYFNSFFFFYQFCKIMDIHHCISLRHMA